MMPTSSSLPTLDSIVASLAIEGFTLTHEQQVTIQEALTGQQPEADLLATWRKTFLPANATKAPLPNDPAWQTFEGLTSGLRLAQLAQLPPGPITVAHWQQIHATLLGDCYAWAGHFRTTDLAKGGTLFARPAYLLPEAHRILHAMRTMTLHPSPLPPATLATWLGIWHTELNALHPFREGNGRTQRELLRQWATFFGYPTLPYARLNPSVYLIASAQPTPDALTAVFASMLEPPTGPNLS